MKADPFWPDRQFLSCEKGQTKLVKSSPELLILIWSCFALSVTSFYISGILFEVLIKDGYYSMDYCPGMHLWGLRAQISNDFSYSPCYCCRDPSSYVQSASNIATILLCFASTLSDIDNSNIPSLPGNKGNVNAIPFHKWLKLHWRVYFNQL